MYMYTCTLHICCIVTYYSGTFVGFDRFFKNIWAKVCYFIYKLDNFRICIFHYVAARIQFHALHSWLR